MKRARFLLFLSVLTVSFVASQPQSARAENPIEKLHKKLFGDDDDDKKDDKKKKKEKEKEKAHRQGEERHYSEHRYYHDEPVVVERRAPVVVERRVYVESEPRYSRPIEADVQAALRQEGYYYGPIDGSLGPGTRSAIREYQFDNHLPVTGRVDSYLLRSLGL